MSDITETQEPGNGSFELELPRPEEMEAFIARSIKEIGGET